MSGGHRAIGRVPLSESPFPFSSTTRRSRFDKYGDAYHKKRKKERNGTPFPSHSDSRILNFEF